MPSPGCTNGTGPRAAAPHPLAPLPRGRATCDGDTEEMATLTASLPVEWWESHSLAGTTSRPLWRVSLTRVTVSPALEQWLHF